MRSYAGDGVASGQLRNRVTHGHVFGKRDRFFDHASTVGGILNVGGQRGTSLDVVSEGHVWIAAVAFGIIEGGLHDDGVPSADEVCVESVSGLVAAGPGERLSALSVREFIDGVEGFEEEAGDSDGVGAGAIPVVVRGGVGHVGPVIGGIEIFSVPTHGEKDLRTKSIFAEFFVGR